MMDCVCGSTHVLVLAHVNEAWAFGESHQGGFPV
jgi:hypothetical protein